MDASNLEMRHKGQSLVEFALSGTVLLLLLSGLVDIGRALFVYIALEDGAGEAALYAAINPSCPSEYDAEGNPVADNGIDGEPCDPPRNALWRAQQAGTTFMGGSIVDWAEAAIITATIPSPYGVGVIVQVTIEYPFKLIMPLTPTFIGRDEIVLTARASQTIFSE